MELVKNVTLLSALAQPTRYRCVELLCQKGASSAGDLAAGLGVPANTMSSHLAILTHAGLVSSTRDGRHVVYRANVESVVDLIESLKRLAP